MSFGFGFGDFVAAIKIADAVRKRLADSPDQFRAIADEYVALDVYFQSCCIRAAIRNPRLFSESLLNAA